MIVRYAIMELLGTMFLTLAVAVTGDPMAIGLMLMLVVYLGGHISGGHYNPVVSFASWIRGGLSNEYLLSYSISQILGACIGLCFARYITDISGFASGAAGDDLTPMLFEVILSMAFILLVLTFSRVAPYKSSAISGVVTGLSLTALLAAGKGVAIVNPALVLGGVICSMLMGSGVMMDIKPLAMHVGGPLIGAAIAAWLYNYLNESGKR